MHKCGQGPFSPLHIHLLYIPVLTLFMASASDSLPATQV